MKFLQGQIAMSRKLIASAILSVTMMTAFVLSQPAQADSSFVSSDCPESSARADSIAPDGARVPMRLLLSML